ncbi:PRP38-domain-containing protein [Gonapodya prolifera JEL478]|uniref:Pre-mRNA-splicing factor 38 n=1 Tax=Gonapodya prolifera (strain JEL478) TaxID=1344416 RepID=A0A139AJN0_GONPJ|nr:PRP38-domain-containing protein [Gonapodya prolifera JEL478]|eukprot:KXS16754.1 PRP38-domain-containing protein [Gonapodya prolifera JEL478]
MANRTVYDAKSVHGTNPQYLVEKILRARIYESLFWKEHCFALTAETLIDKAVQLNAIGGHFGGNMKPTEFICLILKMLQIQPDRSICLEYLRQEDFKYLRALGAYYWRLTQRAEDVYKELEPLLEDFRKLRERNKDGGLIITHMDEFIDALLREERVCDVQLPRLTKREVLEEQGVLEMRDVEAEVAKLGVEDEEDADRRNEDESGSGSGSGEESGSEDGEWSRAKSRSPARSVGNKGANANGRDRSPPRRRRSYSRSRSRSPPRHRRSPSPSSHRRRRTPSRSRSRSRSPPLRDRRRSPSHRDRRDRDGDRWQAQASPPRSGRDSEGKGKDLYEERAERKKADRAALEKKVGKMFKSGSGAGAGDKKKDRGDRREDRRDEGKGSAGKGGGGGGGGDGMSIEETNKLRASLGLKPLKM